ncbi:hypothetical protein HELRODRAFT_178475 [Helobdella robusta]|uniref:Uncharacterized protein n=1 Tax=Helobdella robusta TaxID=6412 RepID=T1FD82_HELRO|nr:hypothetical protein HELRODRAFT_178475 [Helobdella robusta]ESN97032.1 hypothetical protein HELRODRAFT_178475 [Helobdella robusta]
MNLENNFQTFHALKTLRSHGLRGIKLFDITESLISRIKYAAPSWSDFATQQQLQQLQSLIQKLIRFNYLPASYPTVTQIFNVLDSRLFKIVENNNNHVIHPLLPPIKTTTHNLRQRKHNYQVATQLTYQEKTFITFLYKSQSKLFPKYLSDILIEPKRPGSRSSSSRFFLTRVKHSFAKSAFAFSGPFLWNSLPTSLTTSPSLAKFRADLKTHLFSKFIKERC